MSDLDEHATAKSHNDSQSVEALVQKMQEKAAKRKTVKRKAIEDEFAMGMRLIKQRVETTYRTELARKIKDYEAGASKLVEVLERRTRIEREIETKVLQLGEMYQEAYDEMRLVLEGRLSDLEHFMKETRTGKQ